MLSSDAGILEVGSVVYKRMREYAGLVDELHIVVLCGKKSGVELHDGNLHIYPTNSEKKLARLTDAYKKAAEIIETRDLNEADSLITCQDPFEIGYVGVRLKKRFGIRVQLQVHTDFANKYFSSESLKNRFRVQLAWLNISRADGVRVVSDRILKSILAKSQNIDAKKISVLPIFVDTEHIKNVEPIDLKKLFPGFGFYIVMVSRLTHEKQIVWAAEIIKKIRLEHPEVALVVVGDGPLRAQIESFDFVKVVGWAKEPAGYLKGADLFLNTSLYEGYGRTLIEAVAAGVPIVTTDVGVAREVVGDAGAIVDVADGDGLKILLSAVVEKRIGFSISNAHLQSKEVFLSDMVAGWRECLVRE